MGWTNTLFIHILVACFGIGSWITLNGILVESPILTQTLPEGWKLPAYITIVSQIGNVGPFAYAILRRNCSKHSVTATIHSVMVIGLIASFLTIFFWQKTTYVGKFEHSVAFLSLEFFMAIVGCTAVVTFPQFAATFKETYLISLILGEGLSGFIPSLVALLQGIKETTCQNITNIVLNENNETLITTKTVRINSQPLFSATTFFAFIFVMMVTSEAAFLLLNFLPVAQKERPTQDPPTRTVSEQNVHQHSNEESPLISPPPPPPTTTTTDVGFPTIFCLLLQQLWVAALSNTGLPSVQSYSCIPYGLRAYHLTATLSNVASPLGTFLSFFLVLSSCRKITALVSFITLISVYITTTAVMSPEPPLADTTIGSILIVSSWSIFSAASSYAKVSIAGFFRRNRNKTDHLYWWGIATQTGSAIGAITMFVLVNLGSIFHSGNLPCT